MSIKNEHENEIRRDLCKLTQIEKKPNLRVVLYIGANPRVPATSATNRDLLHQLECPRARARRH